MILSRVGTVFAATLAMCGGFGASALSSTHNESFAPANDLHLEDNMMFAANMTQAEFNKIVDDIITIYKPLAKANGGNLSANKNWSDSTVNASANQFFSWWSVNMYGGLARRPEVTPDGFAMVVCHEVGHHFGGFPFVGGSGWAANEGQSDYFATHACAPMLWKTQLTENAAFRETASPYVKEKCDAAWKTEDEQNLCYRISLAGESLARLLAVLGKTDEPHYETPNATVVTETDDSHPEAQCRMDTYLAGGLCSLVYDEKVIPSRKHSKGENSLEAETDSAKYACTAGGLQTIGLRPTCWFKPRY